MPGPLTARHGPQELTGLRIESMGWFEVILPERLPTLGAVLIEERVQECTASFGGRTTILGTGEYCSPERGWITERIKIHRWCFREDQYDQAHSELQRLIRTVLDAGEEAVLYRFNDLGYKMARKLET